MKFIDHNFRSIAAVLFLLLTAQGSRGGTRKESDHQSRDSAIFSAEMFVKNLHREYESPNHANHLGAAADTLFAPELLAFIRKDQNQAQGDVGVLDFDPFCNGHDFEKSHREASIEKGKTDECLAEVRFKNFGVESQIHLHLAPRGKGWRISVEVVGCWAGKIPEPGDSFSETNTEAINA